MPSGSTSLMRPCAPVATSQPSCSMLVKKAPSTPPRVSSSRKRRLGRRLSSRFREAGELGHEADEMHAAHRSDVGIVLRHVADEAANFAGMGADVAAEDAGGAGAGRMKAEQRVDQGRLACAVRPQQADGSPGKL